MGSAASSYSAAPLPLAAYGGQSTFSLPQSNALPTVGRRRVAVKKQRVSASNQHAIAHSAGERTGSYSYVNPDGENILVKYSAGKDGFVILNPREVLPQGPVV